MERPSFVTLAKTCFLADVFFLLTLPVLGYLSILGIILIVPIMLAGGSGDAFGWLRSRQARHCRWSALSSGQCATSLIYLALAVVVTSWDPEGGDIWTIALYLYLLLVTVRLQGAALCACFLSPVSLLLGRGRVARLSSASAFLNSSLGLYLILQMGKEKQVLLLGGEQEILGYLWIAALVLISFLAGLVWGATLQWLAWRTAVTR